MKGGSEQEFDTEDQRMCLQCEAMHYGKQKHLPCFAYECHMTSDFMF